MSFVGFGRKPSRTPSAWTQSPSVLEAPSLDGLDAILRRQGDAWLEQLRRIDQERRLCLDRVAAARRGSHADEEAIASDEHLHLSKERSILLRHVWFIHEERKQARLLRTILEDQAAKREIAAARRNGALDGSLQEPMPVEAELEAYRVQMADRLRDVVPDVRGSQLAAPSRTASPQDIEENQQAIERGLRELEGNHA